MRPKSHNMSKRMSGINFYNVVVVVVDVDVVVAAANLKIVFRILKSLKPHLGLLTTRSSSTANVVLLHLTCLSTLNSYLSGIRTRLLRANQISTASQLSISKVPINQFSCRGLARAKAKPENTHSFRIQLLCLCSIHNTFTRLAKSKPVKLEVSRPAILPLMN